MGVAKRADHTVGRPLLRSRRPTAVRVHYRDDIQRLALPVRGTRIGGERGQAARQPASGPGTSSRRAALGTNA